MKSIFFCLSLLTIAHTHSAAHSSGQAKKQLGYAIALFRLVQEKMDREPNVVHACVLSGDLGIVGTTLYYKTIDCGTFQEHGIDESAPRIRLGQTTKGNFSINGVLIKRQTLEERYNRTLQQIDRDHFNG